LGAAPGKVNEALGWKIRTPRRQTSVGGRPGKYTKSLRARLESEAQSKRVDIDRAPLKILFSMSRTIVQQGGRSGVAKLNHDRGRTSTSSSCRLRAGKSPKAKPTCLSLKRPRSKRGRRAGEGRSRFPQSSAGEVRKLARPGPQAGCRRPWLKMTDSVTRPPLLAHVESDGNRA